MFVEWFGWVGSEGGGSGGGGGGDGIEDDEQVGVTHNTRNLLVVVD